MCTGCFGKKIPSAHVVFREEKDVKFFFVIGNMGYQFSFPNCLPPKRTRARFHGVGSRIKKDFKKAFSPPCLYTAPRCHRTILFGNLSHTDIHVSAYEHI